MQKIFVLDTNVLLHSPRALYAFGDNKVIIPGVVLEELDEKKKNNNDVGKNARTVSRELDKLRKIGKLHEGIKLENGGSIQVDLHNYKNIELPDAWFEYKADNMILRACKHLSNENNENEEVIFVTKDIIQRIKADALDVHAEDYQNDKVASLDEQYTGRKILYVGSRIIDEFYNRGDLKVSAIEFYDEEGIPINIDQYLEMNEFIILKSIDDFKKSALGIYEKDYIKSLNYDKYRPSGIIPRNTGQRFMQEALFKSAKEAPLVIIKGPAGTAKTLFALAVGLDKIMHSKHNEYRRILVCRPNVTMDEDIGFLPGSEEEKIAPYMRAIRDNLEVILYNDEKARFKDEEKLNEEIQKLFSTGIIKTEAVGFLRGRSIAKTWIIIDEAQNLTPTQVKGIITRAGKDSKIILLGDPQQIDQPFLDSSSNGLSYAAEKMKGSKICYQITLTDEECERSDLAAEASRLL